MDQFYPFMYEPKPKQESQPLPLYIELQIPELAIEPKEEEVKHSEVIIIELM